MVSLQENDMWLVVDCEKEVQHRGFKTHEPTGAQVFTHLKDAIKHSQDVVSEMFHWNGTTTRPLTEEEMERAEVVEARLMGMEE